MSDRLWLCVVLIAFVAGMNAGRYAEAHKKMWIYRPGLVCDVGTCVQQR